MSDATRIEYPLVAPLGAVTGTVVAYSAVSATLFGPQAHVVAMSAAIAVLVAIPRRGAGEMGPFAAALLCLFLIVSLGRTPGLAWTNAQVIAAGLPALIGAYASAAGAACLGLWMGGRRRQAPGPGAQFCEAVFTVGAAFFAAMGFSLAVTFVANDGAVYRPALSLEEVAARLLSALAFSVALARARENAYSGLLTGIAQLVFVLGVGIGIALLITRENPLFSGSDVDRFPFNQILLGYLITGAALLLSARHVRSTGLARFSPALAVSGGFLIYLYAALELRHLFLGADIGFSRSTPDAEKWSQSALLIVASAVLFAVSRIGHLARWRGRIDGAGWLVLTLATFKVFLGDMNNLEGLLRVASFLGLGLSLILIVSVWRRFDKRG